MNKFQRKILVTLAINADNAECANDETTTIARMIRKISSASAGRKGCADAIIKSAEIIPNYKRILLR